MPDAHTVLAQILRMVPRMEFEKLAREHGGENRVRSFPCWSQFACLVYAQLSRQTSLRDLVLAWRPRGRFSITAWARLRFAAPHCRRQ